MPVYKFAGFWRRLLAYTIDNIIIGMIFSFLSLVILAGYIFGSLSANDRSWIAELTHPSRLSFMTLLETILLIAISIFYFTFFHGVKGRTPGKMLLGLQVLSTEGTPLGFGIAFLRSVGYMVSSILCLGFIWAAFDRRKQGWHDKIAGTVVIILPRENKINGLVIPEKKAALTVAPPDEKPGDDTTSTADQFIQPAAAENEATAGRTGNDEQKIP